MPIVAGAKHWTLCRHHGQRSGLDQFWAEQNIRHREHWGCCHCIILIVTLVFIQTPAIICLRFPILPLTVCLTQHCQSRAGPNVAKIDKSGTGTTERYRDLAPDIHDGWWWHVGTIFSEVNFYVGTRWIRWTNTLFTPPFLGCLTTATDHLNRCVGICSDPRLPLGNTCAASV